MGRVALQSASSQRARNALAGRRVLVTGHTGFKGGWLSVWLQALGAEVAGFSLEPDEQQRPLFDLVSGLTNFHAASAIGDIRDSAAIDRCFEEFKPEVVFHLAAQPLVRLSYEQPVETFDVNVRGTAVVLDAVRRFETQAAVFITTDKCYENTEQIWPYRENEPMGGWDPYSASKGAAELVISSFRRSFFPADGPTACASARAGNVVGGGDLSLNRLVPDVYRALVDNEPVVLRRPNATRPWQHVLESLSGYLTLAAALLESGSDYADGWNFGPDPAERVTVGEFVIQLADALGDSAPPVQVHADGPHEANLLALDISKARSELGWLPVLSTKERVDLTAAWMLAQHDGSLSGQLLLDQIAAFERAWDDG